MHIHDIENSFKRYPNGILKYEAFVILKEKKKEKKKPNLTKLVL